MGNSPSKNDTATSSSSNSTSTTLSSSSGAELEPDESELSHQSSSINIKSLSRNSPSSYKVNSSNFKISSNKDIVADAQTNPSPGINFTTNYTPSNSQNQRSLYKKPSLNLSSSDEDLKYDSDGKISEDALSIKGLALKARYDTSDDISSSIESDHTFLSTSSLSSMNSTPPKYSKSNSLNNSLDPILERSVETTPEPKSSRTRSVRKNSSSLASSNASSKSISIKKLTKLTSYQSNSSVNSISSSNSNSSVTGVTNIDEIINSLIEIGTTRTYHHNLPISNQDIKYILSKARSIFMSQPTLLRLAPPVKVVGDIHGQYTDLIRIFENCGYPPSSNYLFLGDYVDRGKQSLETFLLMLCFKIKYPENFFMLRGNHESANITKIYGFYDECKRRLSARMWKGFVDVFNTLPLAATVNDKIFAIHGGLSPDLSNLKQISRISRPTDIPETGLLADLLWSDPDSSVKTWSDNDRGVSYCFGKKQVDQFCSRFNFDLIVRGHMVVQDGYEFFNKRKLVTVFSAPNYCGEFDNYGAVMCVDKKLLCSFELLKPEIKRR